VYLTDGYHGILGAHEIYFNRKARQMAPIRLTGVFGGEVLRSVSTFKPLTLAPGLFVPEMRQQVNRVAQHFAGDRSHPVTFAAFKEIPWNIFGSLAASCSQVSFRTPYLDNEVVALAFRAPVSARSEASAVQFVRNNADALARIRTDMGLLGQHSGTLSKLFARLTFKLDYFCNDGMPHLFSFLDPVFDRLNSNVGVLGRHKLLRYRRWFRRELKDYIKTSLQDAGVRQGPWDSSFVDNLAQRHTSGQKNYLAEINAVVTVRAIERLLLRPHD